MDVRGRKQRPMRWRAAAAAALGMCTLCGCGQKGALYLPDHTPQPVISPPAPSSGSAPAPDTTTRKAPRDPDPSTAR